MYAYGPSRPEGKGPHVTVIPWFPFLHPYMCWGYWMKPAIPPGNTMVLPECPRHPRSLGCPPPTAACTQETIIKCSTSPPEVSWQRCATCTPQRARHHARVIICFCASRCSGEQAAPALSVLSIKNNGSNSPPFHRDAIKIHATVPASTPPVRQLSSRSLTASSSLLAH